MILDSFCAAAVSLLALFLIMVGCLATASGAVQAFVALFATKVILGKVAFFLGMSILGVAAFVTGLKLDNLSVD